MLRFVFLVGLTLFVSVGSPVSLFWDSNVAAIDPLPLFALELGPPPAATPPEAVAVHADERAPVVPTVRPAMGLYRSLGAAPRPA